MFTLLAASSAGAQPQVPAWSRWETTLTSANTYSNPYKNLQLRVSWTCLTNCDESPAWTARLPAYGFSDGGTGDRLFKIRATFPQPLNGAATATWRWTTSCSTIQTSPSNGEPNCALDSGLHNVAGTVAVTPSDDAHGVSNPLYTGGLFGLGEGTVSEDGQLVRGNVYLYNDNGPFYWQGDTAWAASLRSTYSSADPSHPCTTDNWNTNAWKCYVLDRAARQFSAVHLAVPQYWMKTPFRDANNQAPFFANAAFPAWSKWNPAFWQTFEQKIQYANEKGLVVFVVGLMEPSYQYFADTPTNDALVYPPQADSKTFARNLAARLAGNFVVLSPGFDTRPNTQARSDLIRAVGAEIDAVSLRQPITNHFGGSTLTSEPGTFPNDYGDFESEPWLDLFLFQSGQASGQRSDTNPSPQLQAFTQRARTMPFDLRGFPLRKGSANAETIYEQQGVALEDPSKNPAWLTNYTPYRARHTGYLSTLSGAFGYSLGVYGLWDWGLGDGPVKTENGLTKGPLVPRSPKDAVTSTAGALPADQMRHLGNLFRAHRWEWLAPAPLVRNNPAETNNQHLQMVVSRDLTRRSTLAYLPDNAAIRLQLTSTLYPSFLSGRWTKTLYNPRNASRQAAQAPTLVSGTTDQYQFQMPSGCSGGQSGNCDWVLELVDTTQGPARVQGPAGQALQVWTAWDAATETWNILSQLVDGKGSPIAKEVGLGEPSRSIQRLPLVTQGVDGGYLVVWEAEDLDGDRTGVFARHVGSSGQPVGRPFQVNEMSAGRQFEPVVAADAVGNYVIAWTNFSLEHQTVDIVARRFSNAGAALGPEFVVNSSKSGRVNRRSPLVSADPVGNLVVGWQEYASADGVWSIVVRELDADGKARAVEREIERSGSEYLALERLEMDALGNFQVIWQRVLAATSSGHFSRVFHRMTNSLGALELVATEGE